MITITDTESGFLRSEGVPSSRATVADVAAGKIFSNAVASGLTGTSTKNATIASEVVDSVADSTPQSIADDIAQLVADELLVDDGDGHLEVAP